METKVKALLLALVAGAIAGAAIFAWDKYVGPSLSKTGIPGTSPGAPVA